MINLLKFRQTVVLGSFVSIASCAKLADTIDHPGNVSDVPARSCYFVNASDRKYADQRYEEYKGLSGSLRSSPDQIEAVEEAFLDAALVGHPQAVSQQCLIGGDKLAPARMRESAAAICIHMAAKGAMYEDMKARYGAVPSFSATYIAASREVKRWRCPSEGGGYIPHEDFVEDPELGREFWFPMLSVKNRGDIEQDSLYKPSGAELHDRSVLAGCSNKACDRATFNGETYLRAILIEGHQFEEVALRSWTASDCAKDRWTLHPSGSWSWFFVEDGADKNLSGSYLFRNSLLVDSSGSNAEFPYTNYQFIYMVPGDDAIILWAVKGSVDNEPIEYFDDVTEYAYLRPC